MIVKAMMKVIKISNEWNVLPKTIGGDDISFLP